MLPLNQAISQAITTSTNKDEKNSTNGLQKSTSSVDLDNEKFQIARTSLLFSQVSLGMAVEILMEGMYKLGLKGDKLPNEKEMGVLYQSIIDEYKNIKVGEIGLAFDLASKGKLDMDAETYQNFSMLYLHRILRAFARYGLAKLNEVKPTQQEQKWNPQPVSDDEKLKTAWQCYNRFRQWDAIVFGIDCFWILYKRGKIIVTPEATLQKVKKAMGDQMITGSSRRKAEIAGLLNDDEYMEHQCYRMAVADYFDTFLKKDAK